MCARVQVSSRPEAVIATRARVVGGYEPPSRDAGNQTQEEQYEPLTARRISSPRRFNIVSFPCSKYTKPGAFHTSWFFQSLEYLHIHNEMS